MSSGRDHDQRADAALKRMGCAYRQALEAQIRVERRRVVIDGTAHDVDVKVCPPAYAWGADSQSDRNCTSVTQAIGDGCNHLTARRHSKWMT